jgi:hypothetical protein
MPVRNSTGRWETDDRRKERRSAADQAAIERAASGAPPSHAHQKVSAWARAQARQSEFDKMTAEVLARRAGKIKQIGDIEP